MAEKIGGIIGGIGPESTLEYYRLIQAEYRTRRPDGSYPRLLINSIDMQEPVGLITAGAWEELITFLHFEIGRLSRAGAQFAILAANTPHIVFDELHSRSHIPLLSIVEATAREAQARGLKKVGLLGTRFTMQAAFYPDTLRRAGIAVAVPGPEDQHYVHERYMGELVPGIFLPETRAGLLSVIDRLREQEAIDGVILGGTELPLILREPEYQGLPFLDTTRIHVAAFVTELLR